MPVQVLNKYSYVWAKNKIFIRFKSAAAQPHTTQ